MKNRNELARRRPFSAILAAVILLAAFLPATAFAQSSEKLTEYLPSSTQMVVGLNVSKLSKSKYYKEGLAWLRAEAGDDLKAVEDAGLDLSKDLEALVVSIPDANSSSGQFTMALSGNFDNAKLLEAIKKDASIKESTRGKTKVYSGDGVDMVFPAKGIMWATSGPDAYRKASFAVLGTKKKSVRASKQFKGLMGDVDTSKGFWMVGDTSKLNAQAASGGPQPKSIGISMDINNGLALDAFADLPSEDDAKKAVGQVETLKKDQQQTAMLALFGARSLVTNLKAKQVGTKIVASTTMTAPEFDAMITSIKAMAQSRMGGGAAPSQPVKSKSK